MVSNEERQANDQLQGPLFLPPRRPTVFNSSGQGHNEVGASSHRYLREEHREIVDAPAVSLQFLASARGPYSVCISIFPPPAEWYHVFADSTPFKESLRGPFEDQRVRNGAPAWVGMLMCTLSAVAMNFF
jgi:hypothetical protein